MNTFRPGFRLLALTSLLVSSVASSEAIPTSFHGETAVLNEVLEKLVEARGRVIDSLGVLLLRLAEQSPSIDAADEVKQRFICNTKQAVEAVESFETSPKAFSQAGHHVVEGFQFWVSEVNSLANWTAN